MTIKNVLIGPHPSIAAASSISSGKPFINPVNINTAIPAPNPKYIIGIDQGVLSPNESAVFDNVNITIWNGTTIENTNK